MSVGGSGTGSKTKPLLPDFAADTGKRVAIIGSGPAGMLAAHDLRVRGHAVVIHEAEPEPGGMLRWAIPEFRLPLRVLRDELRWLEEMGVQLRCGVRVGVDLALTALRNQYDAVIVAVGCSKSNRLEIEGEELAGVMAGLPLLRAARGQQAPDVGKRVVVVGGGNVAVDAAQTALRLGAESVTIVCLEARGELPAFPWAVESALAEKIEFQYGWGPVRFLGDGGVVSGVELQRCERVFDDQGRFNPQWRPDERRTAAADTAVVAVGQARDTSLFAGTGLLRDGGVRADPLTLQTDDEKTFLAGDFATGPSTAVEAMAQGRQAAESVDRFLRGEPIRYGRQYAGPYVRDFEIPIRPDPPRDRARTPTHVCGGAGDFAEIELSLGSEAARREAARCNHCGSPIGFHNTCWFCLPCEVECPYEAIRIEVPYWLR